MDVVGFSRYLSLWFLPRPALDPSVNASWLLLHLYDDLPSRRESSLNYIES